MASCDNLALTALGLGVAIGIGLGYLAALFVGRVFPTGGER